MEKRRCFRERIISCIIILIAVCSTASKCSHDPINVDTVIIANGACGISFQPGVKDWQWTTLTDESDDNSIFSGGFGPKEKTDPILETYNFGFQSSWLSVRSAKPKLDGVSLKDIWTGYNAKSTQPDGSIITTVFGLCVVDYNWKKINSVPFGASETKHLHSFRIIAKSTPSKGGLVLDSIKLTIYANSNFPGTNDPLQLNITMTDTPTTQVVEIVRKIQDP